MALIEHYRLKSIVYLVIIFWLLLCSFLISMKLGPSQYVQSSTEIWSAVATCVSQVASHVDKNLIGWDFGDFCLDACDLTVAFNPAIHNLCIK